MTLNNNNTQMTALDHFNAQQVEELRLFVEAEAEVEAEATKETLQDIMEFIFENKDKLNDGKYVKMSDYLKNIYDKPEEPVEEPVVKKFNIGDVFNYDPHFSESHLLEDTTLYFRVVNEEDSCGYITVMCIAVLGIPDIPEYDYDHDMRKIMIGRTFTCLPHPSIDWRYEDELYVTDPSYFNHYYESETRDKFTLERSV